MPDGLGAARFCDARETNIAQRGSLPLPGRWNGITSRPSRTTRILRS